MSLSIDPDDLDPFSRREPRPVHPKDPRQNYDADIMALLRQLMVRIERLEEEMRQVKEKIKL